MKKAVFAGLVLLLVVGCAQNDTRYTQQSPEIETVKQLIENYNNQAYDLSMYADTSKTFYNNSEKSLSKDEVLAYHQNNDNYYSSRGFKADDQEYEMVVTDDGHTWVNCWLEWEGTLKGSDEPISIPIHLTYRFEDGKIIREVGLWDRSPIIEKSQELEAAANMPVAEQQMQATANTIVKAWNTNDHDLMASVMTPDFVRMQGGVTEFNTAAAYGSELMASNFTAFPDFSVKVDKSEYSGNQAIIHWTVTGTNKGEFNGNPPTNKKITTHGVSIWTFNSDGKAVSEDAYFDRLSMMSQLGYTLAME